MKQAMVLRRRKAERLARARRRDAWLAGGSLLLHLLIFLLLPGLAIEIAPHQELLLELVRPAAAGGQGQGQSSPAPAPLEESAIAQPTAAPSAERAPASEPQPVAAPIQTQFAEQVTPPAEQPPTASSPAVNEATTISAKPVTTTESPQQVRDQPVAPPAAEVIDEPVAQPEAQAVTPVAPAQAQPAQPETPASAAVDAEPDAAEPAAAATGETPGAADTPATAADTSASEPGGEDQTDTGDGGEDEGEGPPPGPSAAELRLLGEYGDAARLRIRSQARNPEQGGSGTVTFEFEVARDGHLIDVRVIRTSGYANLDNDALEATRAAFNERKEKKPFPSDVTVASWVFVMSMKYPLY